jgi:hypothetical protein
MIGSFLKGRESMTGWRAFDQSVAIAASAIVAVGAFGQTPKAGDTSNARCAIIGLVVRGEDAPRTDALHIHRLGAGDIGPFDMKPPPDKFQTGDMISSERDDVHMRLMCGSVTSVDFKGPFRFVVQPPKAMDCVLKMDDGLAITQSNKPTNIEAAGLVAGSRRTVYSVGIHNENGSSIRTVTVFEGSVSVVPPKHAWYTIPTMVTTGRALDADDTKFTKRAIPDKEFSLTASIEADLDVSEIADSGRDVGNRSQLVANLQRLHALVLKNPADQAHRKELATLQSAFGLSRAADYNEHFQPEPASDPELDRAVKLQTDYLMGDAAALCSDAMDLLARNDPNEAKKYALKAMERYKKDSALSPSDYERCSGIAGR